MTLGTTSIVGILTAVVGAILLAFGAQLQHRGVAEVNAAADGGQRGTLGWRQLVRLLRTRRWLGGVGLTGCAMALNLVSLRLAPLIVVQPLGVVALVTTALLNAGAHRYRLSGRSIASIAVCVVGVAAFVTIGGLTARNAVVSDADLGTVLLVLAVLVLVLGVAAVTLRRRFPATINVISAGVLSGFVVTLAKAAVTRVSVGNFGLLTVVGLLAVVAVAATSAYFVQSAYASGPVDLIVAGLTIVDPLVAVSLGILVLGEAAQTPGWAAAGYVGSGALAIVGVFLLAKYHPQER